MLVTAKKQNLVRPYYSPVLGIIPEGQRITMSPGPNSAMARAKLFVRSTKTEIPGGSVFIDALGTGPQLRPTKSTLTRLLQQDTQAKELLKRLGLDFEIVDLSKGILTRFEAKRHGITQTPTLFVQESASQRYVGLKEISQYIAEKQTKDPTG